MDFIEAYRKTLKDAMQQQAEVIANGGCGSIEDYRMKVGYRKGLALALDKFNDVVKSYVLEENEDNR